ncbi:M3 family metallopeptidase [Propioniciclava coleopterorum]|uniref:M3 family metallopeptidase n=1 Tax=Propioniciclava coleopterorum TaxID=2714937 RepID=A0A6G7Y5I3_9ACTN|nr:M3 family metallopeptidase [Propioniciclava coleopterorum]QIK72082.1 M3 family metallopeptidase [Propioniciclava coleopterorum]
MTISADNPLAERSPLPYQLPDFAALTPEHYREAMVAAMERQRAALADVAADAEPATVENVLHRYEASSELLDRAMLAFHAVWLSYSSPELDALNEEFSPKFAQHSDAILLDRALFDRFTELATRAEAREVELDPQDAWLLAETIRSFTRAGVALDEADQEKLRALNTRLAELGTKFQQANRDGRVAGAVVVTDRAELDGLTDEEIDTLATEDGSWRIELVNTTQQPLMAKLRRRDLRRRLFEASVNRGLAGEHDVRGIIVEIARLRAEKAALLGYDSYAALSIESGCAKTTDAVNALMEPLGRAAKAQAARDAEDFAARFAELEPGAEFAPWDWEYVAEIVRGERYGISDEELAPHLDVHKVLDAVYAAAHDLYGITFTPRPDLVGHTPDADVYEVHNEDGSPIGLFLMDFWARPTKQGGAWMTPVVNQTTVFKQLPVVTNNCNYTQATTTISWDGVRTMFHEFGHALHGLFADSKYPSRSGTSTPRDFVEFPSQVNEHWFEQPGRVVPAELLAKLTEAASFNQGFSTLEVMAATLLDQAWHQTPLEALPASAEEVEDFEARALARWGVDSDLVPPRYRSAYFNHIWGSGYAAGYYGYTWSQVMDADAVAWFDEVGGGTRANGDHFRRTLLAPGGSVDPLETYRSFRGRDPEVGPLLDRLGLEI